MISIHTIELSMEVDRQTFDRLLGNVAPRKSYSYRDDKDYIMVKNGLTVWYHKTDYKTKIKLLINPSKVLGRDDLVNLWKPSQKKVGEFLVELGELIDDYFEGEHEIEDFKLTRIDFTKNIEVGDADTVSAYIKVLYNIRRVKGFSPKDMSLVDDFNESYSFDLEGNSNGIEFTAYDKAAAIREQLGKSESERLRRSEPGRKRLKERLEYAKGVLRVEVKLTTQKAIRGYTDESDTVKRVIDLCMKSDKIFMETFVRVVPYGDFYKKDKVVKIINESITDDHMRRKMLRLVDLIHKKKSLHLAQKSMHDRNINRIMEEFAKCNVSPVTISKRHDVKCLKNLYSFFL